MMKRSIKILFLAVVVCLASHALEAQGNEPQGYYAFDYMLVQPGRHDEYRKLEMVWKKIHEANIKAGKYGFWELTQVAYPTGADEPYNYVTRINFRGEKQLADYIENWSMPDLNTLLTAEERALVDRTNEIRTRVKSEIWAHTDLTVAEDVNTARVLVFNYFDIPEGASAGDHLRVEREIWKPVHEARHKDGKMKGWVLIDKLLPYGSADAYQHATVDLYTGIEQLLNQQNPIPYFEKVHAGKDIEKLLAETDAAGDLIRAEVRFVLDETGK